MRRLYFEKRTEKMIKHVFLDLDDTILDFHKAEQVAIEKTLRAFSIPVTEENKALYSKINKGCWEALERGEITRTRLRSLRFERFLEAIGHEAVSGVHEVYESHLAQGHYFLPGAEALLAALYEKKYSLYLATNGIAAVQAGRVASAGIGKYFAARFVSEEVGYNKPSREYFDACFAAIEGFSKDEAVIVGDSLTSDIKGGITAGIRTVWFNPSRKENKSEIQPDAEIASLDALIGVLEKM